MKVRLSKSFALLVLESVFISMAFTPVNADEWMKTYRVGNNIGKHMQQTSDGGYIIVTEGNLSLLKTNSLGDSLWAKCYEDTLGMTGYCVQQTQDRGYIIAGRLYISHECRQALLIKTDSLGDTLWTRAYGSSPGSQAAYCVQQIDDGGYIITGSTSITPGGVWLMKTDSLGNTLWTKIYGSLMYPSRGIWIEKTYDGGYIVGAEIWNPDDIWLMKTDSLGDTLWTRTYGSERVDFVSRVKQTSDSGYIIAGTGKATNYCNNVWLIKTDPLGDNTLWTKLFLPDGPGIWEAWGECVQETYDGGYITTGSVIDSGYGGLFLTKMNSLGDILWTKELFGAVAGKWVLQTPDSGYTVLGIQYGLLLWHTYEGVGVEEQEEVFMKPISLKIYPNPVTYEALITCKVRGNVEPNLKLYDLSGREIYRFNPSKQIRWRIPEELPSGYYFLHFKAGPYKEIVKITILK